MNNKHIISSKIDRVFFQSDYISPWARLISQESIDKVRMYEEIMTNDDNLESNLLTSSLLKKTSGLHAGTS